MLDVDANGRADALTDGVVILRYLFGFTDSTLVEGTVDPAGNRTDPGEIAAFLDTFLPTDTKTTPTRLPTWQSLSTETINRLLVTPDPVSETVRPGDAVGINVYYATEPFDEALLGLGLRLHFDSSKLGFVNLRNILSNHLEAQQSPLADTADLDGDPDTDMYVLVAWCDPLDGEWPGMQTLPALLYQASFVAETAFTTGSTALNFTSSSAPLGFAMDSTSARVAAAAEVVGRHVFYDGSAWEGNTSGPDARDDDAIAHNKQALLPTQTATFANYSSYAKGVNGVMIDIAGLPGTPTANDFEFEIGNNDDPANWEPVSMPPKITLRPGGGLDNSDRITLTWPDNTIQNTWLQVTVLANESTGLARPDVFYFGNAIGESGNSVTDARVNTIDALLARNNPRTLTNPAPIDFPYDFNRDQRVNATDMLIARNNQTHSLNALKLITIPETKGITSPTAKLDVDEGETPLPTHDVILETTEAQELAASSAKLNWLFEFERAQQRPERTDQTEEAVDKLLQMRPS